MKRSIRQAVVVAVATTLVVGFTTFQVVKGTNKDEVQKLQNTHAEFVNKAQNEIKNLKETIVTLELEKSESERVALETVPHPELRPVIAKAAKENGLSVELLVAVGHIETGWDCSKIGSSMDMGCLQIIPDTGASAFSLMDNPGDKNLMNPITNIRTGAWILKTSIQEEHGNIARGLAAYNGGPEAWDRKPLSTRGYAARVLNRTVTPCLLNCEK